MSTLTLQRSGPLRGTIDVPGDKSITHRAIILAALAEGESQLHRYCPGEDCLNMARAFRGMGIGVEIAPERLTIQGKGLWGLSEPEELLDCGNSGTAIRLLTGLLAGQDFFAILTGDGSIRRRPMGRVVRPLREMGATIAGRKGGELAPLAIVGRRLRAISYESPVASAQVKSALLLAGLFAEGTTLVREPRRSRDHTERLFRHVGIRLEVDDRTIRVEGRPTVGWNGLSISIPGDLSAAAFFLVAATIVPGSDVTVRGVGINPTRAGVLEVLTAMGATLEILAPREVAGEPVADLRVRSAPLRGVCIEADLIPQTIDELPILCIAAAFADGPTVIRGAQELRVKESDRIAAMAAVLRQLGVEVEESPDGMTIIGEGRRTLGGARCVSYGDHRVAMSAAIAALRSDGPLVIEDVRCIDTSFPGFHGKLLELLTESGRGL